MLHAVLPGGSILSALFLCVVVERSSFDWLTGSSIDLMADHTVFSSESLSSSLLFSHKKSEKSQRVSWKSVGPDFGTKKLGLPGDEVDNQVKSGKLTAGTCFQCIVSLCRCLSGESIFLTVYISLKTKEIIKIQLGNCFLDTYVENIIFQCPFKCVISIYFLNFGEHLE